MDIQALHLLYTASTGVTTDTRKIESGSIFFALKGDTFNANTFAIEALQKGAAYAVIDEPLSQSAAYSERLILVPDVLATLQALAAYHRSLLRCPVIAITGSNGKTTTKELLAAILATTYKTAATVGNLNNHIGVPLTLLHIPLDTPMAIVEMGANHQREIAGYCQYASPDYALITNIGKAHLEGFGGIAGVLKGKTELYEYTAGHGGKLFVPSSSEVLMQKAMSYADAAHIICYGQQATDYVQGEALLSGEFLSVKLSNGTVIHTQLVGAYNLDNVLAAVCIGRYFGVEMVAIKAAIESYQPSNNRSQKLIIGTNTILLDAYNANPSSMVEALKNFEQLNTPNKIVILGEMMELGEYATAEHDKVIAQVMEMPLSQRIFVGQGFLKLKGASDVLYFENTDQLKAWYTAQQWEHTTQLIKGSRKNALERILK